MKTKQLDNQTQYVVYEGCFVPVHLLDKSRTAELKAYLHGYNTEDKSFNDFENARLVNYCFYGLAVSRSQGKTMYTRDGIHFQSKKLRPLTPFNLPLTQSEDNHEPSELELATAHLGKDRPLEFVPLLYWPGQGEDLSKYERRLK